MAKVYEPVPPPEWRPVLNYNLTVFQNLTICFRGILTISLVNTVAFPVSLKQRIFSCINAFF